MIEKLTISCRALSLACRDPRLPWPAKAVAAFTIAYAFSPIDLIPDFIPVIGHLDDLIIVPCGIWLAIRLIPPELWQEYLAIACAEAEAAKDKPASWLGAAIVIAIWLVAAILLVWWWLL